MADKLNGQGLPVRHTELIKIEISKMTVLRDTFVDDSVHLLILVCSFQWCVLFLCHAKLYRNCPIHDKGL